MHGVHERIDIVLIDFMKEDLFLHILGVGVSEAYDGGDLDAVTFTQGRVVVTMWQMGTGNYGRNHKYNVIDSNGGDHGHGG